MKNTEPEADRAREGPADVPDDPLAAAIRKAASGPLVTLPEARKPAGRTTPPTPDQEGCYFLG